MPYGNPRYLYETPRRLEDTVVRRLQPQKRHFGSLAEFEAALEVIRAEAIKVWRPEAQVRDGVDLADLLIAALSRTSAFGRRPGDAGTLDKDYVLTDLDDAFEPSDYRR